MSLFPDKILWKGVPPKSRVHSPPVSKPVQCLRLSWGPASGLAAPGLKGFLALLFDDQQVGAEGAPDAPKPGHPTRMDDQGNPPRVRVFTARPGAFRFADLRWRRRHSGRRRPGAFRFAGVRAPSGSPITGRREFAFRLKDLPWNRHVSSTTGIAHLRPIFLSPNGDFLERKRPRRVMMMTMMMMILIMMMMI